MKIEKIGVQGLDDIFKGGLRENSSILVKGAPGVGKTIMALQFIYEGAKRGDVGIYITVEEDLDVLRESFKELGMDISKFEKQGLIRMIKQPVAFKKLFSFDIPMRLIETGKVKRVALDSLTLFKYITDNEIAYRKQLLDLLTDLKKVLFLATAEEKREGVDSYELTPEDYLFEALIKMLRIRKGNTFEKCLYVQKTRGQDHLVEIFPYSIKKNGLVVYPNEIPFSLIERDLREKI